MPENWSAAKTAITDIKMRQRDVAALDAKYTEELADGLQWCRDDVAAGRQFAHP